MRHRHKNTTEGSTLKHYNAKGELCALVTNVQKYTIHDGPGIRTEFFFKGCPLHCPWCSNPETIAPYRQLGTYPAKCIGRDKCSWCLRACPLDPSPIQFDAEGNLLPVKMTDACRDCLKCADACPGGGIITWGKLYTMDEMLRLAEEDRSFYNRSGGGVTVSGGDVMMQWEFVTQFLEKCREREINTCVETEACCQWERLDAVTELADLVIFDIKHIDSRTHERLFGVGNELILDNIAKTAAKGRRIVIRTPVVMGINADDENILAIARFIKEKVGAALVQYQLLPYRKMGVEKYDSLGMDYPLGNDYKPPERIDWEKNLLRLRDLVEEKTGIAVAAGTSGKLPL
jgi:pyruvate formate lyase activating enzyme